MTLLYAIWLLYASSIKPLSFVLFYAFGAILLIKAKYDLGNLALSLLKN
jgi:hypothetical protein